MNKLPVGLVILAICLSLAGVILWKNFVFNQRNNLFEKKNKDEIVRTCSSLMNISFPQSTRVLNAYDSSFTGYCVFLQVEVDRKDLINLFNKSPFAGRSLSETEKFVSFNDSLSWWTPDKVKVFKSGEVSLKNNSTLKILVDLSQGKGVVIYLEYLAIGG